jgi:hypothetical protein
MVARGMRLELQRMARVATTQAACVCVVTTAAATGVLWLLGRYAPTVASRALPAATIAVFGLANLGWLSAQSLGSYLRAWREEPLMEASVFGALLVTTGTLVASLFTSAEGTVTSYSLLVVLGMLPLTFYGFRRHTGRERH